METAEHSTTGQRRALLECLLCLPMVAVVVTDLLRRPHLLADMDARHWGLYGIAVTESLLLWGLMLYACTDRKRWLANRGVHGRRSGELQRPGLLPRTL